MGAEYNNQIIRMKIAHNYKKIMRNGGIDNTEYLDKVSQRLKIPKKRIYNYLYNFKNNTRRQRIKRVSLHYYMNTSKKVTEVIKSDSSQYFCLCYDSFFHYIKKKCYYCYMRDLFYTFKEKKIKEKRAIRLAIQLAKQNEIAKQSQIMKRLMNSKIE